MLCVLCLLGRFLFVPSGLTRLNLLIHGTSDKTFCGDLLYAENKFECEGLYAKSYAGFHPVP